MRKLFSQILNEVQQAHEDDKALVLQMNDNTMVRQLLLAALDPKVKFDVEIPTYRENTETDGYSANSLYVEFRRLYIFMEGYKQVGPTRKSALLAQILESIDVSDAPCLIDVLKKDMSKYGLTKEIVNEAFPELIKSLDQERT
jgi:hypothetical protein